METIKDIVQKDTRQIAVTVTDSNKTPFDCTGYTVTLRVKKNLSDLDPLIENTGIVIDGPAGKIQVPLTTVDTDIEKGKYYFRIIINNGTSNVYSVANSTFKIIEGA